MFDVQWACVPRLLSGLYQLFDPCLIKHVLGAGQTINVWRPNTIKHCLVSKHANVEVSDQTVKTCLIKQVIQAAEQVWYPCPHQTCLIRGCPNEQKIAHQTRVQKKCFKLLLEYLMAFKLYRTRPNTSSNSTKQGVQTVKCLVTKRCLMAFGRQTFMVCPGPKTRRVSHTKKNTSQGVLIELSLLSKERKSHQTHILGGTDNMKHDTCPNKTYRRLWIEHSVGFKRGQSSIKSLLTPRKRPIKKLWSKEKFKSIKWPGAFTTHRNVFLHKTMPPLEKNSNFGVSWPKQLA